MKALEILEYEKLRLKRLIEMIEQNEHEARAIFHHEKEVAELKEIEKAIKVLTHLREMRGRDGF